MWDEGSVLQVLIRETNPHNDYAESRLGKKEFTDNFTDENILGNS